MFSEQWTGEEGWQCREPPSHLVAYKGLPPASGAMVACKYQGQQRRIIVSCAIIREFPLLLSFPRPQYKNTSEFFFAGRLIWFGICVCVYFIFLSSCFFGLFLIFERMHFITKDLYGLETIWGLKEASLFVDKPGIWCWKDFGRTIIYIYSPASTSCSSEFC